MQNKKITATVFGAIMVIVMTLSCLAIIPTVIAGIITGNWTFLVIALVANFVSTIGVQIAKIFLKK